MNNEKSMKSNKLTAIMFSAFGAVITIVGIVLLIIDKTKYGSIGLIPMLMSIIGAAVLLTGITLLVTWLKKKGSGRNKD